MTGIFRSITDGFCSSSPTDDTAGLSNWLTTAASQGGVAILEPKEYSISTALPTITAIDNSEGARLSIIGYGGASAIEFTGSNPASAVNLFHYDGTLSSGNGLTDYGIIRDFVVKVKDNTDGTAKRLTNVTCFKVTNRANITIENIWTRGGNIGIILDGVLSSRAASLRSNGNYKGIQIKNSSGVISSCNEVTLEHPSVGSNWQGGIEWINGSPNIIGGNYEGNGKFPNEGTGSGYGVKFIRNSSQSGGAPVGVNFIGGYFEANIGTADVLIQHSEVENITWNFQGQNFNRVGTTFCTNNIRLENTSTAFAGLTVRDTAHNDYGGYVASTNNRYIAITGTGLARGLRWRPGYCNQYIELPNNAGVGKGSPGVNWGYFDVEANYWGV